MATLERDFLKEQDARRARYEMSAGAVGAIAGASFGGIFAGPAGAAAGAVVGAAMGAATGWAVEMRAKDEAVRDHRLDREIGVTDGDIGVPGLQHPPAKIGAFSREVSGASSVAEAPQAEGPMQAPPEK
jgi:outer membrane lipoprotein SlyB